MTIRQDEDALHVSCPTGSGRDSARSLFSIEFDEAFAISTSPSSEPHRLPSYPYLHDGPWILDQPRPPRPSVGRTPCNSPDPSYSHGPGFQANPTASEPSRCEWNQQAPPEPSAPTQPDNAQPYSNAAPTSEPFCAQDLMDIVRRVSTRPMASMSTSTCSHGLKLKFRFLK